MRKQLKDEATISMRNGEKEIAQPKTSDKERREKEWECGQKTGERERERNISL